METFARRLHELQRALRRDPADSDARKAMEQWLDDHCDLFERFVSPDALRFGISPDKQPRRLQFLRHLLLHGFLPPRVEEHSGHPWSTETINLGVITGYFYSNTFSLLEAGLERPDVAVFAAYPATSGEYAWIEQASTGTRPRVFLRRALMVDQDGLVWRHFRSPVPIHYLFPVDNYYRSKFDLVQAFATSGVPMPGSTIIRQVCEDKALLHDIAGRVPGLRLASEICLDRHDPPTDRMTRLDDFVAAQALSSLVTKPVDGFGGAGIDFWSLPAQRDALLHHLHAALGVQEKLLVQERTVPVPTRSGREWNIRQYVLREGPGVVRSAWKRVRIGFGAVNTSRGAQSITTTQLLEDLDLGDEHVAFARVLDSTDLLATHVLHALETYLHQTLSHLRRPYHGSGSNLEPDLLALDFMITREAGSRETFSVYLNEINDFASGGMRDFEVLAHRQALPEATEVRATQPFSLAPHVLNTAAWRGGAYKAEA